MDSELETTHTRSKVLKRAAVGAAAVWSVPMFASAASAAASPGAGNISKCAGTDPNTGFLSPVCELQQCGPAPNGTNCFCYPGAKKLARTGAQQSSGCCVCGGNEFCSQTPACTGAGNANCPAGWKCTFNFCGQTCVPPCGQGISDAAATMGGRTAAKG
jgi:hypothetical protein